MTATVRDNPSKSRYEIHDGDQSVGLAAYELTGDTITFTHTETDPAFQGRGLARQLVIAALEDARRRELAVLPSCPYVRKVIADDADAYLDLVPPEERARFGLTQTAG